MRLCTENKERIERLLEIPEFDPDTFGRDFSDMLKARRTFDEAIADTSLGIVVRQRLKIIQEKIFSELSKDPAQALLYGY